MIIVLKGADFSQSNIGTLSTWRITRSLGAGATYEGPISIDKDAALSATVTLAEGYEIGTAGVTVTMGGTVLSGVHSISGNVITITIAEVTGNVVIKVPTINVNTGEEDEPTVPDTPTQPDDTTYTFEDVTSQVNFNGGYYINGTTGSVVSNSNWKHSPFGSTTSIDLTPYAGGKMRITLPVSPTMPNGLGIGFYSQFSKEATFISGYTSSKVVSADTYETVILDIPETAQCFRTTWYANQLADEFKCELAKAITTDNPIIPEPEPEPEEPDEPDTPVTPDGNNLTSLFTWTSNGAIESNTGVQSSATDWRYSNYVNIEGYESLDMMMIKTTSGSTTKGMAFYDANKTYISGVANNGNGQMTPELRTIPVPENAVYLRTSWCDDDNSMFKPGQSDLEFFYCIATGTTAPDQGGDSGGDTSEGTETDITALFESTWTEGSRMLSNTGKTSADTNWKYSDYIDVSAYKQLRLTMNVAKASGTTTGPAFYTESKNYISGVNCTHSAPQNSWEVRTIDVPVNAKYIRTCWYSENHTDWTSLGMANWEFSCVGIS